MKMSCESKSAESNAQEHDLIAAYSQAQLLELRTICDRWRELIDSALPKAISKVWHGSLSGSLMRTPSSVRTRPRKRSTSCFGTARRSASQP